MKSTRQDLVGSPPITFWDHQGVSISATAQPHQLESLNEHLISQQLRLPSYSSNKIHAIMELLTLKQIFRRLKAYFRKVNLEFGLSTSPRRSLDGVSAPATSDTQEGPIASQYPSFKYAPLDTTRKQIRLIKFCGTAHNLINCQLRHVDIGCGDGSTNPYRALSYTWGPPLPKHRILINNQLFEVRQNLHDFLMATQQYTLSEEFWIDQICIDQENILEKNHQVSMMASIRESSRCRCLARRIDRRARKHNALY